MQASNPNLYNFLSCHICTGTGTKFLITEFLITPIASSTFRPIQSLATVPLSFGESIFLKKAMELDAS